MGQQLETPSYLKIIIKCVISLTSRSVTWKDNQCSEQFNFKSSLIHLARGVGYFTPRNSGTS